MQKINKEALHPKMKGFFPNGDRSWM